MNFPVHERLPVIRNEEMVASHVAFLDGASNSELTPPLQYRATVPIGFSETWFCESANRLGVMSETSRPNASEIRSPVAANKLISAA